MDSSKMSIIRKERNSPPMLSLWLNKDIQEGKKYLNECDLHLFNLFLIFSICLFINFTEFNILATVWREFQAGSLYKFFSLWTQKTFKVTK